MTRLTRLTRIWLLFACVALVGSMPALAEDDMGDLDFTDESVTGTWGFSASGTIVPPAFPVPTPAAAVGIMEFDGAGICVISDTINIGGTSASRVSDRCDYEVNSDGTGSLSAQFSGDPGPVPLSFVLVDDANSFRFVRTDLGVASGAAKRQIQADRNDEND